MPQIDDHGLDFERSATGCTAGSKKVSYSPCPNPELLRQLCEGEVCPEQQRVLVDHIDQCESCRRSLDQLGAGEDSARWLASSSPPPCDSDALSRRLKELKSNGPAASWRGRKIFTDLTPWLEPGGEIGQIGEFELLECVGRGGMGIVFRAYDSKLGRTVAIKVLSPALLADPSAPQRFLREARSAASINHRHVVTVHAVAQSGELPYLVMEFVRGESLQQRLERAGQLPLESTVAIARQTAEALAAAHASGVIHRDVKPANILLEAGTDDVKLTDFGLARGREGTSLTQSGLLLGTPEYMAPEQVQGATVDHRSDLFSLGSVLYTMCAGTVPFSGPSIMSTLHNVCTSDVESVEKLNPRTPPWLATLIRSLHARQPQQRPATAQAVVETIRLAEASANSTAASVVQPPPISTPVKRQAARRSPKQKRFLKWLPMIVPAMLGLLVVVVILMQPSGEHPAARRSPPPPSGQRTTAKVSGAAAEVQRLPRGPAFATASNAEELITLLEDADGEIEVELTSSEPYRLPASTLEGRDVRLIAASGVTPVLNFEVGFHEAALAVNGGKLRLERLRVEAVLVDELADDLDEKDGEVGYETLILCESGSLTAVHCEFISEREATCLAISAADCTLINCEVRACAADSILWRPEHDNTLAVTNCVLIGATNISIEDPATGKLQLQNSTLFGWTALEVAGDDELHVGLSVIAKSNLFDAEEQMLLVRGDVSLDARGLGAIAGWEGTRNSLPKTLLSVLDEKGDEQVHVDELDGWRRIANIAEVESKRVVPAYLRDRQTLFRHLGEGGLRSSDLQIRNASSTEVGADLRTVGPGRGGRSRDE